MAFPPSKRTDHFALQHNAKSITHFVNFAKNLNPPFPPFNKKLVPIVIVNKLSGCPWQKLGGILHATFMNIDNSNRNNLEKMANFGDLVCWSLFVG